MECGYSLAIEALEVTIYTVICQYLVLSEFSYYFQSIIGSKDAVLRSFFWKKLLYD